MAVTRKQREHLRELMKEIDIAMFTTIGQRGFPVSRPLSTQRTEFDGEVLWFFVRANSPKVAEIARNPRVNVAYASKDHNAYLSVAGRASLVRNRMKIRDLWHDALKIWFRKGLDDPELALIRVRVNTIEYWEGPSTAVGRIVGMVTAAVTGRDTALGENRMVRVRKVPAKRAARKPAATAARRRATRPSRRVAAVRKRKTASRRS
jgi:general stress protein 26